jgi:hypothetical protein
MGEDEEYLAWSAEIREVYEERVSILCDGGKVTAAMDEIARREARRAHAARVAKEASGAGPSRTGHKLIRMPTR